MDKKLDSAFERVERNLATLIESLIKFNPSERSAQDLVAAERDLQVCLKELETHQNNAARIQELRNETSALDAQTKDIIQSLWNMRKELKAVTTTTYSHDTPTYDFTTAELLAYARRISRNTLPPPGVTNGVDLSSSSTPGEPTTQDTPGPETGASTPAAAQTPGAAGGQTPSAPNDSFQQQPQSQANPTGTDLPIHLKPAVNPLENAPFYPWPTVDQIRSGALARYQDLVNRGIDPKNYDPDEEERKRVAEEDARKEAEEKARQEREEQERKMREERERMAREMEARRQAQLEEERRRPSVVAPLGAGGGGASTSPAKPKQFTFLDGDDDDDDDE